MCYYTMANDINPDFLLPPIPIIIDIGDSDSTSEGVIGSRAIPDLSKCRATVYKLFEWRDADRLWHCKLCSKKFQHHKQGGSTTLNTHMKKKHPNYWTEVTNIPSGLEGQGSLNFRPMKKSVPQPVVPDEVKRKLVHFVVLSDQPFTTIEDEAFRDLLTYVSREDPNVQIPTRQTLRKNISEMFVVEKDYLRSELKNNVGKISLIVDCWTSSNQHSFQAVIATWMDNNWEPQTCLLDLSYLEGSHSGENLAEAVANVISDYDLWGKIMSITSDNASNMNTMFRALESEFLVKGSDFTSDKFRVRCLAHIVNLACQQILGKAKVIPVVGDHENEDLEERALDQDENDVHDGDEDADENEEEENETSDESLHYKIIYEFRKIVRAIRSSPQRRMVLKNECEKLGIPSRILINDVTTRWNSTLNMLLRVRELKPALLKTIERVPELSRFAITDEEWTTLDTLIKVLQPFKESTVYISSSRPSLSETTLVYHVLFAHLEKIMNTPNSRKTSGTSRKRPRTLEPEPSTASHPRWLISAATRGWEKLREYYPTSDGLIYVASTVLDPRCKLDFYKAIAWDQTWQKNAKKLITSFWEFSYKRLPAMETDADGSMQFGNVSEVDRTGDIFESFYSQTMRNYQKSDDELKQYLAEPVVNSQSIKEKGIQGWWKENAPRFPLLSRMAKDVVSVHGTGVSVERFFSSGPDLLSARRQSLSPKSIQECLSLKFWLRRKSQNRKFKQNIEECRNFKWFGDCYKEAETEMVVNVP